MASASRCWRTAATCTLSWRTRVLLVRAVWIVVADDQPDVAGAVAGAAGAFAGRLIDAVDAGALVAPAEPEKMLPKKF